MARVITEIAANRDLTLTVPEGGNDEIGVMSKAFNNMIEVIHKAFIVVKLRRSTLRKVRKTWQTCRG
jgi:methyl-accepting chemotaxis protein